MPCIGSSFARPVDLIASPWSGNLYGGHSAYRVLEQGYRWRDLAMARQFLSLSHVLTHSLAEPVVFWGGSLAPNVAEEGPETEAYTLLANKRAVPKVGIKNS